MRVVVDLLETFVIALAIVRVIGVESIVWDVVQTDDRLVGVLHDQVFAILLLHHQIDDASQDSPGVVHAQVDLVANSCGELLRAEDDVTRVISRIDTRHIAEL